MNRKFDIIALPGWRSSDGLGDLPESVFFSALATDLMAVAEASGILERCARNVSIWFRKASERAVLRQWSDFYHVSAGLVSARTEMERRSSEYRQLTREHLLKEAEKTATLAKLQADAEESYLRRDRAAQARTQSEQLLATPNPPATSDDERQLNDANERRRLDVRWELHESMRSLHTLVELQRWRRQQRDLVLEDRCLSPEEQREDLEFLDELYQQKRAEVKSDTRIFDEG